MTALLTFGVVADNFYRPSFTEASLSVREDSNWKIECVVVYVPMALFKTCLQTWSKLFADYVKEALWWYGIFKKQRSFLINFSMKYKWIMPFDNMLLCPFRYFHLIYGGFTMGTHIWRLHFFLTMLRFQIYEMGGDTDLSCACFNWVFTDRDHGCHRFFVLAWFFTTLRAVSIAHSFLFILYSSLYLFLGKL